MKKIFTFILALVAGAGTMFASDTQVDGIWYNFDSNNKTAEVTYRGFYESHYSNEYSGNIVIPANVTYDGEVYSVTSIGEAAFYECSSLTSVTIPNSVTSIGVSAFSGCSGLTSVTIPNSVTSIGDFAFWGCSGLTSIIVESGNSVYDSRNNCNAIIETATNTLIIGCKNTIIPNSVTSIGAYAFSSCSGLTSVTIPNSVTSIGEGAFAECTSLTSLTIPNSVTSIGEWAFGVCSGLTSVTIPNSVTSIGDYAFWGCSSLTSVTNYATTPQTIDASVFGGEAPDRHGVDKSSCTLYVPKESVALYKAADVWREFVTIIGVDAPEGVENVLSGQAQGTKLIRDGQIYILRGEKEYTMQGQEVK